MSSIVGLQGKFKGNEIIKMLKTSKHYGPDASGVYLDDIKLNINEVDLSESEGAAILVYGASDVVLDNIKINYTTPEDTTA
ncbi:MAG: asparagine synthetase B, partial [Methanobrevibacter sp.]|nr:asparagine synthetase B [Methanobrevibacter sp.]